MYKFNLHILTLLGAILFCIGLVNIVPSKDDFFMHSVEMENEQSERMIPLLSSAVNYNRRELILPDIEQEDNFYETMLQDELRVKDFPEQNSSAEDAGKMEEVKEKPSVTTRPEAVKEKHEKKAKRDYVERWAIVTAYCPCAKCCGYGSPGRTSIGKSAWKPGIAADPKALPYGTEIYVEGYGRRYVDDTGGAMRRSWRRKGMLHLDIRMTYHYQAIKWGRRIMKVRIYKKR